MLHSRFLGIKLGASLDRCRFRRLRHRVTGEFRWKGFLGHQCFFDWTATDRFLRRVQQPRGAGTQAPGARPMLVTRACRRAPPAARAHTSRLLLDGGELRPEDSGPPFAPRGTSASHRHGGILDDGVVKSESRLKNKPSWKLSAMKNWKDEGSMRESDATGFCRTSVAKSGICGLETPTAATWGTRGCCPVWTRLGHPNVACTCDAHKHLTLWPRVADCFPHVGGGGSNTLDRCRHLRRDWIPGASNKPFVLTVTKRLSLFAVWLSGESIGCAVLAPADVWL